MLHVGVFCCRVCSLWPCGHLLEKGWPLGCRVSCVLSLSQMFSGPHQNQGRGWRRETGLSPPVKYFTNRSKAVLLFGSFMSFLSCVCCFRGRLCIDALWSPAGKTPPSWLSFVMSNCGFVTFPLVSWVRCGT